MFSDLVPDDVKMPVTVTYSDVIRLIKKRMDLLCVNNKIWRLQTAVKADFKIGIRFAEFLEYKKEGLMVGYGPDKTDYYLMARIYK